jgi:hypothetical protein
VTPEQFAGRHPRLYHMAAAGAWPSLQHHGLLSTSALLDLFEIHGDVRDQIESVRRPASVEISHPVHGRAVIRDQKPLREAKLRQCLIDMQPAEWYAHLNRYVFFWPSEERLHTLLGARSYRSAAHIVITVDTWELLARHGERVVLSPINSGATVYQPATRGRHTFAPLTAFPDDLWRQRRLAEVAVAYAVPDLAELTLSVVEWQDGVPVQTILTRDR